MDGFRVNKVASDLIDNLDAKEQDGLQKVVHYFNEYYPQCDFFPAYNLGGGVARISLGKKVVGGKNASYSVFRIRLNVGGESGVPSLVLATDSDKPLLKEIADRIPIKFDVKKAADKDRLKQECTFGLAELSDDIGKLAKLLNKLKSCELFSKAMKGDGCLPDSYEEGGTAQHDNRDSTGGTHNSAIEGEELWREAKYLSKNKALMDECKKRDKYTCQACDSRIEVNNKFIIDCHHTIPLAKNGTRKTKVEELVSLCPTCHRIAHTSPSPLQPYDANQIREIRLQAS